MMRVIMKNFKINSRNVILLCALITAILFLGSSFTAQAPTEAQLLTFVLKTKTNNDGHFMAPHGLKQKTEKPGGTYYPIYGILVAVQHQNGAWNTIDTSNKFNNTFFWNDERVEGWISRGDQGFANRPVRIVVFAQKASG
jgi:hypothetical protein